MGGGDMAPRNSVPNMWDHTYQIKSQATEHRAQKMTESASRSFLKNRLPTKSKQNSNEVKS